MTTLEIATTPQHFAAVQHIAHTTWPVTFGAILSSTQIQYMLQMMYSSEALEAQVADKGHVFIVAKAEGQYLGFVSFEHNYQGTTKTKIHKIYILPDTQGKGIGKSLLEVVTKKAVKNGNNTLTLNVNRDNGAIAFYEKMDFQKTAEEDIDIGNGFFMNDAVMEKVIG